MTNSFNRNISNTENIINYVLFIVDFVFILHVV